MKSILAGVLNRTPVPLAPKPSFFTLPKQQPKMTRYLGAMEAQSTVFAIVDRIAQKTAAAKFRLYRLTPRGVEERREVTVHPALTVWRKPNPFMTGPEFVETIQQHYELAGEWWWLTARSERFPEGPPVELWPVRPDRMEPISSTSNFISGYRYLGTEPATILALDEVIFNKRPSPLDPYRGIGPVGSLLLDIEGETAAAEWNTNFFRNGAEPGGLIRTVEGFADDAEFEQFQARWSAAHRGVGNAHRVGILEGDMEWIDRRYTQRDMQFEQLRRFNREALRQAWGFPKPLLGDVEDVNRANAEAAHVVFAEEVLVPRLNRLKASLNDDFLPLFGSMGDGYEFDYDNVVPPNPEELREDTRMRVQSAVALIAQGFDPAATLEAMDLPPISHSGIVAASSTAGPPG